VPVGARPRLPSAAVSDFDGDGASDVTVVRPSSGTWFNLYWRATAFTTSFTTPFGVAGDIPVNGDYDGDRRATSRSSARPRDSGSSCDPPPA
jgi:hypothetical protein